MTNRKVISISMNEEEYKLFKESKEYLSKQFLNQKISNSEFFKHIFIEFYNELNVHKNMKNE